MGKTYTSKGYAKGHGAASGKPTFVEFVEESNTQYVRKIATTNPITDFKELGNKLIINELEAYTHLKLVGGEREIKGLSKVIEQDTDPSGRKYMILRKEFGKTLTEIVKGFAAKKPEECIVQSLQIYCGILDALQGMHDFGVFHFDVNPNNILVTDDAEVTLLDLGRAMRVKTDKKGEKERGIEHFVTFNESDAKALTGNYVQEEGIQLNRKWSALLLLTEAGRKEATEYTLGNHDVYMASHILYWMLTNKYLTEFDTVEEKGKTKTVPKAIVRAGEEADHPITAVLFKDDRKKTNSMREYAFLDEIVLLAEKLSPSQFIFDDIRNIINTKGKAVVDKFKKVKSSSSGALRYDERIVYQTAVDQLAVERDDALRQSHVDGRKRSEAETLRNRDVLRLTEEVKTERTEKEKVQGLYDKIKDQLRALVDKYKPRVYRTDTVDPGNASEVQEVVNVIITRDKMYVTLFDEKAALEDNLSNLLSEKDSQYAAVVGEKTALEAGITGLVGGADQGDGTTDDTGKLSLIDRIKKVLKDKDDQYTALLKDKDNLVKSFRRKKFLGIAGALALAVGAFFYERSTVEPTVIEKTVEVIPTEVTAFCGNFESTTTLDECLREARSYRKVADDFLRYCVEIKQGEGATNSGTMCLEYLEGYEGRLQEAYGTIRRLQLQIGRYEQRITALEQKLEEEKQQDQSSSTGNAQYEQQIRDLKSERDAAKTALDGSVKEARSREAEMIVGLFQGDPKEQEGLACEMAKVFKKVYHNKGITVGLSGVISDLKDSGSCEGL